MYLLLLSTLLLCEAVLSTRRGTPRVTILQLDYTTYNDTIRKNPDIFVLFYNLSKRPTSLQHYQRAVNQLSENYTNVQFAQVDIDNEGRLREEFNLTDQALFFYENNKLQDSRKEGFWYDRAIVDWMKTKNLPPPAPMPHPPAPKPHPPASETHPPASKRKWWKHF